MKLKSLIPILVAVVALTACRGGEKSTITGGYGSAAVSGQVVTTESSSPEGVQVSVRGTGQTMTLAADGRFAFGDVAEGAILDFRRASDGTEASFQLDQTSGPLLIELGKTVAQRSGGGRRRGVGRGSKEVSEIEGVIRSAAADSIVIFSSKKVEVTVGLTPDTVIRKGSTVLTPADLVTGMRVHARVTKTDASGYTASLIIVQDAGDDGGDDGGDDDSHPAKEYEGIVRSASAGQLVILDSHKHEVTFVLTADTVIRKGNSPIAAADIKPDWRVHVRATTAADGTNTATQVIVQNTNGKNQ
jgi:hypothetical protein